MLARLAAFRAEFPLAVLYITSTAWLSAGTIAQLISFIILARALGVEQFGLLMVITAATHLGTHLCGLGAGEGMVRRVARRVQDYPALLGHNILLTLGTGAVLVVVLTLGINLFVAVSPDGIRNFLVVLLFVVSNVLFFRWILLTEQIFIAHWQIGGANSVNVGFALAKAAVTILACAVVGVSSLEAWALWHAGVHVVWAGLCLVSIARFGAPQWRILPDELRLGFHFSTPWFFMTLRKNIDLLVLGLVASPAVVGAFSVARRIVETSEVPSTSLERLLYPKLARAGKEGVHHSLALLVRYLGPIIVVAAATSAALYTIAPWVPLLVGDSFIDAVDGIQFLCWSLIIIAVKSAAFEALGAADQHGVRAMVYNAGSIAGSVMIGLSTYFFLVEGAFIAIYATAVLIGLLLWATLIRLAGRQQTIQAVVADSQPDQVR